MRPCDSRHRALRHCTMGLVFAALWGCAAVAGAGSDYFALGVADVWWSSNVNHPVSKRLKEVTQKKMELNDVAFTPGEDWVVLFGGNGYWTSNLDLPACKKLSELQQGHTLKCVAFGPKGGWTVFYDQNGFVADNVPDEALKKMQQIAKDGGTLRSVAYGPRGGWVLLYDDMGVAHGGISEKLAKTLNEAVKNHLAVRCVSFTNAGDWICLTSNGWWTSNLDLPASKAVAELIKQGESLKWIATSPDFIPHDFAKWSDILHQAYDGKLAGGYAFEVLDHGKVVAEGAEGWARAPWEKEHPSVKWTLQKPMGVASVSKTVTAVALLKLWEETGQKFSLDDPFWPQIKRVCPTAHEEVKHVTIRQLLMHRSGFKKGDDYTSPKDLEKLLNEPLANKPGTKFEYDNNNFYTARLVLEEIGHVQYTPYVKEHVLKPMGITHMETHAEKAILMCGYGKPADKRPGYPFDWNCDTTSGAAGWYANVPDLGRFLNGIREHTVLSPATTQIMLDDSFGWDFSKPGWAKGGWWVWDEAPRYGNFHSAIAHFPDEIDAVILSNCDTQPDVEDMVVRAWRESMEK